MVKGRKPLATALKEQSGALAKNPQRRNKTEPKAKVGYPEKPQAVIDDAIASVRWDSVCATLSELNVLTTADLYLLEQYCHDYSQYCWLRAVCREGNVAEVNDKGNRSVSPEASQVHKYADRMLKQLAELGLTPSARSRLHVVSEEEHDPFTEWMAGNYG